MQGTCPVPCTRTNQESLTTQVLRNRCPIKLTRNRTRKIRKIIFAIPAEAAAIPPKPKNAAINATTKKPSAQRNIF